MAKKRIKATVLACVGVGVVALAAGVSSLMSWHKAQVRLEKAQAAVARQFASFSAEDVEQMRVRPPSGSFIVRTSGSCSGRFSFTASATVTMVSGSVTAAGALPAQIFLGQSPSLNGRFVDGTPFSTGGGPLGAPVTGGSVNIGSGIPGDAFAGWIPPQPLVHHRCEGGWQVARVKGTFFWFDEAGSRAPYTTLPESIQSAAEEIEKQGRVALGLKKRIDLMPWNATNGDKLRQKLLADLKQELIKLHNLEAHMVWISVRQGIPGYPSLVTDEAEIAWQLGSPPIVRPPASSGSLKIELRPVD